MLKFSSFIGSKSVIAEELTDEQLKTYSKFKIGSEPKKATDHFFGNGNKITEPVSGVANEKSEIHQKVEKHIGKEISTEDYTRGITSDKYGREVRLGRAIKDKDLQSEFASDPVRSGAKSSKSFYATIHRGAEVAGQTNPASTKSNPSGHSWKELSCKNNETGSNRHYLEHEIQAGTVVMFGHDHDGKEIYRATLHPHINDEGHYAYGLDAEYGVKNAAFTKHAQDVARRLSGEHKGGSIFYHKHDSVYDDSGDNEIVHPNISDEHIEKRIDMGHRDEIYHLASVARSPSHFKKIMSKTNLPSGALSTLASNPNIPEDMLNDLVNHDNDLVKRAALSNPSLSAKVLEKSMNAEFMRMKGKEPKEIASDVEHSFRVSSMLSNPNATEKMFTTAMNSPVTNIRYKAIQGHPNLSEEQLNKLADSNVMADKQAIADRENLPPSVITKLLSDKKGYGAIYAPLVRQNRLQPEHLRQIFDLPEDQGEVAQREAVINHFHRLDDDSIEKAIKNSRNEVLRELLKQDKLKTKHVDMLADNKNLGPYHAFRHPNVSKEKMDEAISKITEVTRKSADHDKMRDAIQGIANNPKVTDEQLSKIIATKDDDALYHAVNSPNAKEKHYLQAMDVGSERAKRYGAMKGMGKHESVLERIIDNRDEYNLYDNDIIAASKTENPKLLTKMLMLSDHFSGNFARNGHIPDKFVRQALENPTQFSPKVVEDLKYRAKKRSIDYKETERAHNKIITADKTHKIPVGESVNIFRSRYSKYLRT